MLYVRIARGLIIGTHAGSGALGGLGGGGVLGGGSENPARPFPPRRRTVAASFDDREGHDYRVADLFSVSWSLLEIQVKLA